MKAKPGVVNMAINSALPQSTAKQEKMAHSKYNVWTTMIYN